MGNLMNEEYDFRNGVRGALDPLPAGKTRITIRLDDDIIEWFRQQAEQTGGGNYQTMNNAALRQAIERRSLEDLLRRIIRDELGKAA